VSRLFTTGRLIKLLTYFPQPTSEKDIELGGYLTNAGGPVPLVLDLHITHERWGSSSDPTIDGHLHYPNDLDSSLNETPSDKIRSYSVDYYDRPSNDI
jgi:hypothetical protein